MKAHRKLLSALTLVLLFAACSAGHRSDKNSTQMYDAVSKDVNAPPPPPAQSVADGFAKNENAKSQTADSAAGTYMSSSAAMERGKDTSRRFVRTADLRFRVKNVIKASYTIEDITNHFGGIVTYTHLQSQVDNTTLIPVSADSSLETTYFTLTNTITLRVPSTNLDTTLKCMAPLVDFFDYRTIKARNVSFDIFSNMLEQQRIARHNARLSKEVDNSKTKKLSDVTDAENDMLQKEAESDNVKVDIFRRDDSIKYSVVTMSIYQRQTFKRVLIANDKNIDAYEPGFGQKFVVAIKYGWTAILELILGLAQVWGVLLIITIVIYATYRRWFKRPKE
jgi:hypothetical protein